MSTVRRRRVPAWALAAAVAAVFLAFAGLARLAGHWHTPVDPAVYFELIPRAATLDHPR